MDANKIGKFIASIRKSRKLTQHEFAKQLCISNKTVSKWEVGAGLPDVGTLLPLADYLGVTVNELLAGEHFDKNIDKFEADKLTKETIDYSNKKSKMSNRKKSIIFIVFLCVMSLFWYFLTSFNSISVYQFTFKSDDFVMTDGFMMTSNMENIFQLNNLQYVGNDEVVEQSIGIELYIDDDDDFILYRGDYGSIHVYEPSDDAKILNDNFVDNFEKLTLVVYYTLIDGTKMEETIVIDVEHKFSNNKLFDYSIEEYRDVSDNITQYQTVTKLDEVLYDNDFEEAHEVEEVSTFQAENSPILIKSYNGEYKGLEINFQYFNSLYYINVYDKSSIGLVYTSTADLLILYDKSDILYHSEFSNLMKSGLKSDLIKFVDAFEYVFEMVDPIIGDVS